MLSFIGTSGKCMSYVEFHLTHQSLLVSVKNCCLSYTTSSLSLVSINSSRTQMWKKPKIPTFNNEVYHYTSERNFDFK